MGVWTMAQCSSRASAGVPGSPAPACWPLNRRPCKWCSREAQGWWWRRRIEERRGPRRLLVSALCQQHDGAGCLARFQIAVRLRRVLEGIGVIDVDLDDAL